MQLRVAGTVPRVTTSHNTVDRDEKIRDEQKEVGVEEEKRRERDRFRGNEQSERVR